MKLNIFNRIFRRLFQGTILNCKPVPLAEDLKHHEQPGWERKLFRDGFEKPCVIHTLGSPPEDVVAAFVAGHSGDPSMLDELVKKGYVVGSFKELGEVFHKRSLRDTVFPAKRESVANDAREAAVANAFSETEPMEESADGWFKVSPYGVFRGKQPGRQQHFHEEAAQRMVAEFNSLRGKLGRMFRGVPIYIGHPDVDPTIWNDDRRLGKVTQLEARADGLWAYGEWNSLGRENQTEGFWVYPSPRWDAPAGQNRFEPDRLISIGLTNTPRIETSEPLANSLQVEDSKTEDTRQESTETPSLMDPKLIREKLGLAPETTDEEVFAKIESMQAAATAAETRAMEAENAKQTAEETAATEKEQLQNSLSDKITAFKTVREQADNALLDLAERDGKITKAERADWLAKLASDAREATINSLAAIKPKLNTKPLAAGQSREDREQSDTLREQVANAVTELQEKRGMSYVDAWGTVKKDAKFAAYFSRGEG